MNQFERDLEDLGNYLYKTKLVNEEIPVENVRSEVRYVIYGLLIKVTEQEARIVELLKSNAEVAELNVDFIELLCEMLENPKFKDMDYLHERIEAILQKVEKK